jgi:hypothetical protein
MKLVSCQSSFVMSIQYLQRLVERDDLEGFCAAADKLHPSDAHKAIDAMDSI